jgi:integrase
VWPGVRRAGLPRLSPALAPGPAPPQQRRLMMAAGVPARTIMEVLGHSEIGVTMNTYTHVLAQLREDAADAIDRVLGA